MRHSAMRQQFRTRGPRFAGFRAGRGVLRRAYTLVEMTLALAVMSVLMGGLASAMMIATRAIPGADSRIDAGIRTFQAAEEVTHDLLGAQSFTMVEPSVVEFTVPDRTGDAIAETIRYEWSGVAPASLTRVTNGSPAVETLKDVYEFSLQYGLETQSDSTTVMQTVTSPEGILAYFDGWSGVTPLQGNRDVSASSWAAQYFTYTPPGGATAVVFTKARVMMRRDLTSTLDVFSMAVHRSKGGGSYNPDLTMPLATSPTTLSVGLYLGTSYQWVQSTFSPAPITDLSRNDYCLLVKGGGLLLTPIVAQYYQSSSAPSNNTVHTWTTNSGGSWSPSKNYDNQDLRFYVYGSYVTQSPQTTTINRTFLRSVRLQLRSGPDAAHRIDTEVQVLNAPEVTGL